MASSVSIEHLEIVQGAGGPKARIRGSRIRVMDVAIWHEKLGMSPDVIVHDYPPLTLADVHAALAYYWDHREEIERTIADDRAFYEAQLQTQTGPLQEKLQHSRVG